MLRMSQPGERPYWADECTCEQCISDTWHDVQRGTYPLHGWYRAFAIAQGWTKDEVFDDEDHEAYQKLCAWCICADGADDDDRIDFVEDEGPERHPWGEKCTECRACLIIGPPPSGGTSITPPHEQVDSPSHPVADAEPSAVVAPTH